MDEIKATDQKNRSQNYRDSFDQFMKELEKEWTKFGVKFQTVQDTTLIDFPEYWEEDAAKLLIGSEKILENLPDNSRNNYAAFRRTILKILSEAWTTAGRASSTQPKT